MPVSATPSPPKNSPIGSAAMSSADWAVCAFRYETMRTKQHKTGVARNEAVTGRKSNHYCFHHRGLRICLAAVAVQTLVGGAAPAVQWQDITGQARSQAAEENDGKNCLYQII